MVRGGKKNRFAWLEKGWYNHRRCLEEGTIFVEKFAYDQ